MKNVKINLENVVKYKRNGFSYVTLFFVDTSKDFEVIRESELESMTFRGYEDVKGIVDRVNKEMMQIGRVEGIDSEARLYVEYTRSDNEKYFVVYNKTKENEDAISEIKESQKNIINREKKALEVKEIARAKRNTFLLRSGIAVATLVALISYFGKKTNLQTTNTYKAPEETTNTYKAPEETTKVYQVPEETAQAIVKPTLKPIPEALVAYTKATEKPVVVVQTIKPMVATQTNKPVEVPQKGRPMVVNNSSVTDGQEEKMAIKRMREALNLGAQRESRAGAIMNTDSLYGDDSLLAAYKLIKRDLSFLSNDESKRYEQLLQAVNVYKRLQIDYLINGVEEAKISNFADDSNLISKLLPIEIQTKEYVGEKRGTDKPIILSHTYDESDPMGDYFVSGYISIANAFSTRITAQEGDLMVQFENQNLERFIDSCSGKAIQR